MTNIQASPRFDRFDSESIHALVHTFYAKVQLHPELNPVFQRRVKNWPEHLGRMVKFWTTILTGEMVYVHHERGGPPQLHQAIEELEFEHFETWLGIWQDNAIELFSQECVNELTARSANMARVLSRHLVAPGGQPPRVPPIGASA